MAKSLITNDIRRQRFEHGEMSQAELARQVGVTRQTILALEASKYSSSLELAFKIAAVFGKPIQDLFQYRGEEY